MPVWSSPNVTLIDKKLFQADDYCLSETGDICIVENEANYIQAAQNRVISEQGSRVYDENFWSELALFMKENSPVLLTDDIAYSYVEQAIQEMISDGRIEKIESVKILERTETTVTIEMKFKVGVYTGEIVFEV